MCGRGCTLEGGNPGVSLPLHNVWERTYAGGRKPWGLCIICSRGRGGGGGNPGMFLPLHNVWERMCTGGGKSWGVPTSA